MKMLIKRRKGSGIASCPRCNFFASIIFGRGKRSVENASRQYRGDVAAEDSIKFSATVVVAKTSST